MNIHPYSGPALLCLLVMTSCSGPNDQEKSTAKLNETTLLPEQPVEPYAPVSAPDEQVSFTRIPHFEQPSGFVSRSRFVKYADLTSPEVRHHRIYTSRDTTIIDGNGLTLHIPAQAFKFEDGTLPEEPVDFQLQSFLDNYSIINQGLTTVSNGSLIETAGMFYCEAGSGGKKLELRKPINVSIQTAEKKPGMQTFYGKQQDGFINWVPAQKPRDARVCRDTDNKSYSKGKSDKPVAGYTETGEKLKTTGYVWDVIARDQRERPKQIMTERPVEWATGIYKQFIKYDELLWKEVNEITRVEISMRLLENARYELIINPSDNAVLDSIIRMSTRRFWDQVKYPKKINERDDIRYVSTFFLRMWKSEAEYKAALAKLAKEEADYRQELGAKSSGDPVAATNSRQMDMLMSYVFQISQMGWINCDRFYNVANKNDIIVNLPLEFKGRVNLALRNVRSFVPGFTSPGKIFFRGVPAGEEFTLLCFDSNDKGDLLLSKIKGVADGTQYDVPRGRKVTMGELKDEMTSL